MSTQHHQHSIYEPAQKTKNPDPRVILSSAFSHIQCGDLIQSQSLIVIPPNSSVQEACEILTNHGIYYAPVQSTHNPTSYDGAFTFRSSCHFLLDHFRTSQRRKLSKSNSAIRQPSSGTIGPCKLARDYVTIGFVQCKYDNSVCQAAKLLRNRSHRMAIVNAEGKLIGVLTQSMVFRRFIQPFDNLDKLFPKQLCDQFPFWFKKPLYSLSEKVRIF